MKLNISGSLEKFYIVHKRGGDNDAAIQSPI